MSPYSEILQLDIADEGVASLVLKRPERKNALSLELRTDLSTCLKELAGDSSVKAVLLSGSGSSFCAGFDLKELSAGDAEAIFAEARAYHRSVYTFPKPLIAAVNGPALAGGMDLALMCDVRIASENAAFGQPQVRHGIPAAYELMRTVLDESTCRHLCLTGDVVDAQTALSIRLVTTVVSEESLVAEAVELTSLLATNPSATNMKSRFLKGQPDLF